MTYLCVLLTLSFAISALGWGCFVYFFIISFGAYCSVGQWIIAALGYMGIVYVMFSGARRLELRQKETMAITPSFRNTLRKRPSSTLLYLFTVWPNTLD